MSEHTQGVGRRALLISGSAAAIGAATVIPATAGTKKNDVRSAVGEHGTFDTLSVSETDNPSSTSYPGTLTYDQYGLKITTGIDESPVEGYFGLVSADIQGGAPSDVLVVGQTNFNTQNPLSYGGAAIHASSDLGNGVRTEVTSDKATADTVVATNAGSGRAVLAESSGDQSTITARNNGSGPVFFAHAETASAGASISNAGPGSGASFSGGRAAINLRPGVRASHPSAGTPGDLYVDKSHRLWFFGNTWVRLA